MVDLKTSECWLNCLVDRGMFSDEVAVTYPMDGEPLRSVFVPASAVRGEAGQRGSVRVKLLRNSNQLLAVLPSANPEIVAVSERDVNS